MVFEKRGMSRRWVIAVLVAIGIVIVSAVVSFFVFRDSGLSEGSRAVVITTNESSGSVALEEHEDDGGLPPQEERELEQPEGGTVTEIEGEAVESQQDSCGDGVCAAFEACLQDCSVELWCGDATDNDRDGTVDCHDFDCVCGGLLTGLSQATRASDPFLLSMLDPVAVVVSGNYAYVASDTGNSLTILDISDRAAPRGVGFVTHSDPDISLMIGPSDVFVLGDYAYVTAAEGDSLAVIDVSDPANPDGVGQILKGADVDVAPMDNPTSVFVSEGHAYVTAHDASTLIVIDVSSPGSPRGVGHISRADDANTTTMNGPTDVFVADGYAYVVAGIQRQGSLTVIDVSDPAEPDGIGFVANDDNIDQLPLLFMEEPRSIYVKDNYAYVASFAGNSLSIINVTDPFEPGAASRVIHTDPEVSAMLGAEDVFVEGNYAYVASSLGGSVAVINVTDPWNPDGISQVTADDATIDSMVEAWGLAVDSGHVFVATGSGDGLAVVRNVVVA